MNPALICATNFWLTVKSKKPANAVLVHAFDGHSYSHLDTRRMFDPWRDWFHIEREYVIGPAGRCPELDTRGIDYYLFAMKEYRRFEKEISDIERRGTTVITPSFPPAGTWENDAAREISHHDFEHGGLNEWNGAAVKHSAAVLRLHSRSNCRQYFPFWAFPTLPKEKLQAIDLGSGAISHLRWGAIHGFLDLILVDPLLPLYELVLARHGLDRLEATAFRNGYACLGEELMEYFEPASIDFLYSGNALDHTMEPGEVMRQIATILRPGGRIGIAVATCEGTRQNWDQFHKTDIYLNEDGLPLFRHQNGPAHLLLGSLKLEKVHLYTDALLCFSAIKDRL